MRRFFLLLSIFVLSCGVAFAHPGGTDKKGGHYNHSTGEYHYHHGLGEHDHTYGFCPYDEDFEENVATYLENRKKVIIALSILIPASIAAIIIYIIRAERKEAELREERRKQEEAKRLREEAERRRAEAEKRRREEEERQRKEQERLAKVAYYRENDLRKLSGMPDYFSATPDPDNPEAIPKFTSAEGPDRVWLSSSSSTVYHSLDCRYAAYSIDALSEEARVRTPCRFCQPPILPDTSWVKEYVRLYKDCIACGGTPYTSPAPPYHAQPTISPAQLVQLYKENYPKAWNYISKHSKTPVHYLGKYHRIWGRLQESIGDNIALYTLSEREQALVDYPQLSTSIYISSTTSKTYHATPDCYSLLRTESLIDLDVEDLRYFKRCTKCVPPQ